MILHNITRFYSNHATQVCRGFSSSARPSMYGGKNCGNVKMTNAKMVGKFYLYLGGALGGVEGFAIGCYYGQRKTPFLGIPFGLAGAIPGAIAGVGLAAASPLIVPAVLIYPKETDELINKVTKFFNDRIAR